MPKRDKSKPASLDTTVAEPTPAQRPDITTMVQGLLDVLERHDADPNDGALSLLTALMQAADRVMELSTPEEIEHNRAALTSMLEHAQIFVEGWPHRTPDNWRVH